MGFSLLGWIAFKLQTAFARSQSFFEMFIWQYFSVWTFFLIFGSLSVVSQIFIYFCWPFYLYFIYRRLKSRSANRHCAKYERIDRLVTVKPSHGLNR